MSMRKWALVILSWFYLSLAYAEDKVEMAKFMALPDAVRQALDSHIKPIPRRSDQVKALHKLLYSGQGFNISYNNQRTKTAAEAFNTRSGNCLSLAALYIASARYLGFQAYFQLVEIPYQWMQRDNTTYYLGHVNALVVFGANRVTAEFLGSFTAEEAAKFKSTQMSDTEALSRYYNNLGVEAMVRGENQKGLEYLTAAIETNRKYADAWVNLGVWYKGHKRMVEAEQSYLTAVKIQSNNTSALSNLLVLYQGQGRALLAAEVANKLNRHRLKNPYYLAGLAEKALREQQFPQAIVLLKKAIKKQDDGRFYQLLGQAYFAVGQVGKAQTALEKSVALASSSQDELLRSEKLAALRSYISHR